MKILLLLSLCVLWGSGKVIGGESEMVQSLQSQSVDSTNPFFAGRGRRSGAGLYPIYTNPSRVPDSEMSPNVWEGPQHLPSAGYRGLRGKNLGLEDPMLYMWYTMRKKQYNLKSEEENETPFVAARG